MNIKKLYQKFFRTIICQSKRHYINKWNSLKPSDFYDNPERLEKIWYASQYGVFPNLKHPKDINHLLLQLNIDSYHDKTLHDLRVKCADKYLVRDYVASKGLSNILVPLLGVYDKFSDIDWESLPNQFVVKTNFGCGHNLICKDKQSCNRGEWNDKFDSWMDIKDFGLKYSEWHYCEIPHKIIVEDYIKFDDNNPAIDYKFQCFNGHVYGCFLASDRTAKGAKFSHFDNNWNNTSGMKDEVSKGQKPVMKPDNLDAMIQIAETLSANIPYCRIDLYSFNNKVLFGEMTFTPAGNIMGYYKQWMLEDMLDFYYKTK